MKRELINGITLDSEPGGLAGDFVKSLDAKVKEKLGGEYAVWFATDAYGSEYVVTDGSKIVYGGQSVESVACWIDLAAFASGKD